MKGCINTIYKRIKVDFNYIETVFKLYRKVLNRRNKLN